MDPSLLDTDIFSEVLKAKDQNVARKATAYRQQFGRYTISTPRSPSWSRAFKGRAEKTAFRP